MAADIKIKEIDYIPQADPVDEIAGRPAPHQADGQGQGEAAPRGPAQDNDHHHKRRQGHSHKEGRAPGAARPGVEKAEGGPVIDDMGEVEKTRHHGHVFVERKAAHHQPLGKLIRRHHQGDDE